MSYIGKTPLVGNFQVCDAISTVNNQAAYTMQVGSVNVLPESVNNMMVSLNGVVQKPGSSFTISDSTITFSSALVTGDVINFIQIFGDVLSIGTPSDGAVTSTKLASNSVTTAKITDSNVTSAKTNFVSTSSAAGLQIKGDGTTDGTLQLNCSQNSHGIKLASPAHSSSQSYTLKFPTGNVTANKFLKVASVSGSGTSGIGQLSFADAGGGGITNAQQWRISAAQGNMGSGDHVTNNWEVADSFGYGGIGSAMGQSQGIFTFPATGIWLVQFTYNGNDGSAQNYVGGIITSTTNNSSYGEATQGNASIQANGYFTGTINFMFDVTSTSTHKVRFAVHCATGQIALSGNTNRTDTGAVFIRLGDT